jgi:hypothetical protein
LDIFVVECEEAHLALARGEGVSEAVEAVRRTNDQLGEAYANSAGINWNELQRAAAPGTKLLHGARPEALSPALRTAIEGPI